MPNKSKIYMPTEEEDAEINRGIAEDPDAFEVPDEMFKRMKKLGSRGRPKLANPKVLVSLRYDADIIESFKAGGDGWQTRMNDALREWISSHKEKPRTT